MDHGKENALGKAASAYLRTARLQPVEWMEWGPEAFAKAQQENKPMLLDIGAVWCHWCHVMDRESYEDADTAALINENFIAVKVDRDERPDVDARYQAAVAAISGQGGWPLTAFLTPEGKPYFGGTYFPPDDRYGRPGFRRVLGMMADAFEDKPEEVAETANGVMELIETNETFSGRAGDPGHALLDTLIVSAIRQFDARNGGFGTQPKFPHSAAIDLLLDAASRGGENAERAREVATTTLARMASGGIHDQLAGGFHRYSVDERWIVPHFEKMAYDNSELLKNYAHAYASFGDESFAEVARGILRWMDEWLSDRERGGFYASQDADDSLDDDGDYFTWTRDEAAAALTPEEFSVAAPYFNLRPVGDMHHNPMKNVLHVFPSGGAEISAIARNLKQNEAQTRALLEQAKRKMYGARLERRTPYIDKTVYSGWNGMCISAYFSAARALRTSEPAEFALRSLDRLLSEAWSTESGLAHVVAYGEGVAPASSVKGVLEDYAFVANAALDAWEWSGEMKYFTAAKAIVDRMIDRLYDREGGAFFDSEHDPSALAVLKTRRKPLQDAPTPSGNATAATALLRLATLVNEGEYETLSRQTLETFAGIVEHFGLYAASYGLALRRMVEGGSQVCVLASDDLAAAAERPFTVDRSVVRLPEALGELPPALAETLPHVPGIGAGVAVVCRGHVCLPPVTSAEALRVNLAGN